MEITADSIRATYELPLATEVEVCSHTFNENEFWTQIKSSTQTSEHMHVKGKKNDLLSPFYERVLDIIYKCLESRVAVIDDVSAEKMCLMHVILCNFKCDWAKHIFDCLEYFIVKVGVVESEKELRCNVGYGFMVSYLLKLKGISLKSGSKVHPNAISSKPP